jgi:hypothetical protein
MARKVEKLYVNKEELIQALRKAGLTFPDNVDMMIKSDYESVMIDNHNGLEISWDKEIEMK